MAKQSIAGILPALFTPMHSDGQIDHDGVKTLVDCMFNRGVHGLYVCGSTGEGILLSAEERQALLETVAEATAGRGALMVHIGAVATDDAIKLGQHAKSAGADAVSAVPPFTFGKNRKGIIAHYRALSHAVDLPMYLYNIPSLTGVDVTLDIIEELAQLSNVRGMKFSSQDLFAESSVILNLPDFDVFHGSDETLLYGLMAGAVGGIGMTYNFWPELYVAIYNLLHEGKIGRANELQRYAARFVYLFLKHSQGNEVGFGKELLPVFQPVAGGPARMPNLPVEDDAFSQMQRALSKLGPPPISFK